MRIADITIENLRENLEAAKVETGNDHFQNTYAEALAELVEDLISVSRHEHWENRAVDLVNSWIESLYQKAYRNLADSINSSYSHVMGRVEKQAEARADFDFAEALRSYRTYGTMDLRSTIHPNRA